MRGMGEVRSARQLGREPGVITRTVIKLHDKAQQRFGPIQARYSSALHHVASVQKHIQFAKYATRHTNTSECKSAICTFLDAQAVFGFFYRLYRIQHVNSAAGSTAQPSSLGEVLATVM